MERHLEKQRGYLLVVSIVLIIVLTLVGVLIINILKNQVSASSHVSKLNNAYNIAISGLEIAKREVIQNGKLCENLGSSHTNESLFIGQFSTTGTYNSANSTLQSSIGTDNVAVTLANASNFAPAGIVKIGNEYIYYHSKSGNTLNTTVRGKGGSTITSHSANAAVSQNQCFITATAGVTSLSAPDAGIATVSSVIVYTPGSFSFGGYQPSLALGGLLAITGNGEIYNSGVTLNGTGYTGSTAVSQGSVLIIGNGKTTVNNGSGSPVTSSSSSGLANDIVSNVSTTNTVFESYFGNLTETTIENAAISGSQYYATFDSSAIDGVTNKIIYIDGDASLSGNTAITVGTEANPVVLYINGGLSISGNASLTVHGIIYIDGSAAFSGNGNLLGTGSIGVKNSVGITGNGDLHLTIAPGQTSIENVYNNLLPNASMTYISNSLGIQPVIH